ncbi:DUF2946 domain-containing protein [Pseudomonas gingeri]|uniref:DUF2946 domain-containing protein n=1 Tax=Pseudomonas gingeri TaxID=117681 RepID=A0A7Y7YHV0_9PSED|nr:DUF2946 domain-containing protein [Pseudomonas gingeri]NWA15769.1 DUF2946 domain-containing protein [Pseudomonas gingeri]NWA56239.1 DUF2946 domain-containing protein [Pseudomonas gingeri]NWA97372.1 DUF2946 domain-containing protein [Pseudomonas gingeri]NWB05064.1 DUF2946 domain-containing protein [Pseudomonas gingeri]
MRRTRTQQRFATWLAMLALGLLLFVPTISRTVQALEHQPPSGAWCPEHVMAGAQHQHPAGDSGHGGVHEALDACGYCSLFHDSPALLWAVAVLPPRVPAAPNAVPCKTPIPPYQWPLDLCPRGPPLA